MKNMRKIIASILAVAALSGCGTVRKDNAAKKETENIQVVERTEVNAENLGNQLVSEPLAVPEQDDSGHPGTEKEPAEEKDEVPVSNNDDGEKATEVPTVEEPITVDLTKIANEVLLGKWGNGAARVDALRNAGYDYEAVQKKVNELLGVNITVTVPSEHVEETVQIKSPSTQSNGIQIPQIDKAPVYDVNGQEITNTAMSNTVGLGDVIAHSDTMRNTCDMYGCYDADGFYRPYVNLVTDPNQLTYTVQEQPAQSGVQFTEPVYTEPVANADIGDWTQPSWYDGKVIQCGNYSSTLVAYGGQAASDNPHTAVVNNLGKTYIGDHADQGFTAIENNNVCYIGGVKFVKVSEYWTGKNWDSWLEVVNGIDLVDMPDSPLAMYTCLDEYGVNCYVSFWRPA